MHDHDALLHAILTDPSDDLTRLAYADWCEEQGHTSRARFIQAQLALFHGPRGYKTEEECPRSLRHHWREDRDLYRRVEEECKPSPDQIAQELFGKPSAEVEFEFTVDFERGFIFRVETTQEAFLDHVGLIFRRCPVEWVVLTDRGPIQPPECDWFVWFRGATSLYANCAIDNRLWHYLEGGRLWESGIGREHPSPNNAHADLSRACVRYGRILTGLPDLWTPPRDPAP